MSDQDIDNLLQEWDFDPFGHNVRMIEAGDRMVLQMRIEMGVLQLETEDRPDGWKPEGFSTYLAYQQSRTIENPELVLEEKECLEVDREFAQFYHRRVCWLQLKEFANAVRDADHTLALMDFCKLHSPSEEWTLSHEQYRPFVLYHRTQAQAMELVQRDNGAEFAIEEINSGLDKIHELFVAFEAEEQFEEDELVVRLREFRESLRDRYEIGKTLQEQLADAVAAEQYEVAARIRDKMNRRDSNK